jgi:hypothetical protein
MVDGVVLAIVRARADYYARRAPEHLGRAVTNSLLLSIHAACQRVSRQHGDVELLICMGPSTCFPGICTAQRVVSLSLKVRTGIRNLQSVIA